MYAQSSKIIHKFAYFSTKKNQNNYLHLIINTLDKFQLRIK